MYSTTPTLNLSIWYQLLIMFSWDNFSCILLDQSSTENSEGIHKKKQNYGISSPYNLDIEFTSDAIIIEIPIFRGYEWMDWLLNTVLRNAFSNHTPNRKLYINASILYAVRPPPPQTELYWRNSTYPKNTPLP